MNIEHVPHKLLSPCQYRTLKRLTRITLPLIHSLIDSYSWSIPSTPNREVVHLSQKVALVHARVIEYVGFRFHCEDERLISAYVLARLHVEDTVYVSTENFIF